MTPDFSLNIFTETPSPPVPVHIWWEPLAAFGSLISGMLTFARVRARRPHARPVSRSNALVANANTQRLQSCRQFQTSCRLWSRWTLIHRLQQHPTTSRQRSLPCLHHYILTFKPRHNYCLPFMLSLVCPNQLSQTNYLLYIRDLLLVWKNK